MMCSVSAIEILRGSRGESSKRRRDAFINSPTNMNEAHTNCQRI